MGQLDRKLWLALAMPVTGVRLDARTLAWLDADGDGRIRQPDVVNAAAWLRARLRTGAWLPSRSDRLALAEFGTTPEGAALLATAREVLSTRGGGDAISVAQVEDARASLAGQPANGDGVVTVEQVPEATRPLVAHIVAVTGGTPDRSGGIGVTSSQVDAWKVAVGLAIAWSARAGDPGVRPLGDGTEAAMAALDAAAERVEDWFVRSRLVAFDPAASSLATTDWTALGDGPLDLADPALRAQPIAPLDPSGQLPLSGRVHPAWSVALDALGFAVAGLVGPKETLDEPTWRAARSRLDGWRAWQAAAPPEAVRAPGREALVAWLRPESLQPVLAAIAEDEAARGAHEALDDLDRLVRGHRDFAEVVDNFAAFGDFYGRRAGAFQAGTLVVDRRACHLCLDARDVGAVSAAAAGANACVAFASLSRGGATRTIAALVTSGDAERLRPGRNGLFWDREGVVWDATLTSVHENPIGLRQAFWAPYRRAVRLVEEQITAWMEARNAASQTGVDSAAAGGAPEGIDVGTVAAIGVAVGGLAAAFGALVGAFFGLGPWMPVGFLAVVLSISLPSVALAAWKIRTRSIAPLLDAVGWAINGDLRVNVGFGEALTEVASLPVGARVLPGDPFRDRGSGRTVAWAVVLAALVLGGLWAFGKLDPWLPPGRTPAGLMAPVPESVTP